MSLSAKSSSSMGFTLHLGKDVTSALENGTGLSSELASDLGVPDNRQEPQTQHLSQTNIGSVSNVGSQFGDVSILGSVLGSVLSKLSEEERKGMSVEQFIAHLGQISSKGLGTQQIGGIAVGLTKDILLPSDDLIQKFQIENVFSKDENVPLDKVKSPDNTLSNTEETQTVENHFQETTSSFSPKAESNHNALLNAMENQTVDEYQRVHDPSQIQDPSQSNDAYPIHHENPEDVFEDPKSKSSEKLQTWPNVNSNSGGNDDVISQGKNQNRDENEIIQAYEETQAKFNANKIEGDLGCQPNEKSNIVLDQGNVSSKSVREDETKDRSEDSDDSNPSKENSSRNGNANDENNYKNTSTVANEPNRLYPSQYRGVVPQPNGRWGAQIYEKHTRVWLGTFNSEEEAAKAYDRIATKFRGKHAITNFGPITENDPENAFIHFHTKEQLVDMLRKHRYDEKLEQSKKMAGLSNDQNAPSSQNPSEAADKEKVSDFSGSGENVQNEKVEREHLFEKALTPSDVGNLNRLVIPKEHAERNFPMDIPDQSPCKTLSCSALPLQHSQRINPQQQLKQQNPLQQNLESNLATPSGGLDHNSLVGTLTNSASGSAHSQAWRSSLLSLDPNLSKLLSLVKSKSSPSKSPTSMDEINNSNTKLFGVELEKGTNALNQLPMALLSQLGPTGLTQLTDILTQLTNIFIQLTNTLTQTGLLQIQPFFHAQLMQLQQQIQESQNQKPLVHLATDHPLQNLNPSNPSSSNSPHPQQRNSLSTQNTSFQSPFQILNKDASLEDQLAAAVNSFQVQQSVSKEQIISTLTSILSQKQRTPQPQKTSTSSQPMDGILIPGLNDPSFQSYSPSPHHSSMLKNSQHGISSESFVPSSLLNQFDSSLESQPTSQTMVKSSSLPSSVLSNSRKRNSSDMNDMAGNVMGSNSQHGASLEGFTQVHKKPSLGGPTNNPDSQTTHSSPLSNLRDPKPTLPFVSSPNGSSKESPSQERSAVSMAPNAPKSESRGYPPENNDHRGAIVPTLATASGNPVGFQSPLQMQGEDSAASMRGRQGGMSGEGMNEGGDGQRVKCFVEGSPFGVFIDLSRFHSTQELRETLLSVTEGTSVGYQDKDGDMILLGDESWDFFLKTVRRINIRR